MVVVAQEEVESTHPVEPVASVEDRARPTVKLEVLISQVAEMVETAEKVLASALTVAAKTAWAMAAVERESRNPEELGALVVVVVAAEMSSHQAAQVEEGAV